MEHNPGCSSVTGVSRDKANWMDNQVDCLNLEINIALNHVKVAYPLVDMSFIRMNNYILVGACGSSSLHQINDKVLDGFSMLDASVHLHQYGYSHYFAALVGNNP